MSLLFSHDIYYSRFPVLSSVLLDAQAIEVLEVDAHNSVRFCLINVAVPSALPALQHLSHSHLDRLPGRCYLSTGCIQVFLAGLAAWLLKMLFMASRICCLVGASFDSVLLIIFSVTSTLVHVVTLRATDQLSSAASRGADCHVVAALEHCLGCPSCATKRLSLDPPRNRPRIPSPVSCVALF